jgi:predicted DNA-binding protein (UPF0278 family)
LFTHDDKQGKLTKGGKISKLLRTKHRQTIRNELLHTDYLIFILLYAKNIAEHIIA